MSIKDENLTKVKTRNSYDPSFGVLISDDEYFHMTADQLRYIISDYIDAYSKWAVCRWDDGTYTLIEATSEGYEIEEPQTEPTA